MEAAMNRLSAFFKGRDTHSGLFYPEHYLLAVFPNLAQADRAQEKLRHASCGEEDVVSASGEEVVHFAQDHWLQDGLWGFLMRWLSRLLGTEEAYADEDLAAAKNGAAFIAVHCPTEKIKTDAWRLLVTIHPVVARYYRFGGIEHLAGEN
jgi:hypothetical protein